MARLREKVKYIMEKVVKRRELITYFNGIIIYLKMSRLTLDKLVVCGELCCIYYMWPGRNITRITKLIAKARRICGRI